jgi:hypothetical protein
MHLKIEPQTCEANMTALNGDSSQNQPYVKDTKQVLKNFKRLKLDKIIFLVITE